MSKPILFLGGPWHGQYHAVDSTSWRVPDPNAAVEEVALDYDKPSLGEIKTHNYVRHKFGMLALDPRERPKRALARYVFAPQEWPSGTVEFALAQYLLEQWLTSDPDVSEAPPPW